MRIISGRLKSRLIKAPAGSNFRPTTDRVRENIFNILGEKNQSSRVLDLYAGSGSLGIEALSRGAGDALFVDNSQLSVEVILNNLEDLDLKSNARVIKGDVLSELRRIVDNGSIFNLIFLDPPYSINVAVLQEVLSVAAKCLDPSGLIVLETGTDLSEGMVASLREIDKRKYGITRVYFFKK